MRNPAISLSVTNAKCTTPVSLVPFLNLSTGKYWLARKVLNAHRNNENLGACREQRRGHWGLIDPEKKINVQIAALAHLPCTPCMRRDSSLSGAPPQKTMTETNSGSFVRKRKGQQVSQWCLFIFLSLCIMAQTKDFFQGQRSLWMYLTWNRISDMAAIHSVKF